MNRIDYPVNDFNLELFLYSEYFEKMSSNKFTHKSKDITITLFDSNKRSRCGFTKMKFKHKKKAI